jgi:hypothetical protein
VDDFTVKYINEDDAKHLINALETRYKVTVDWEAKIFSIPGTKSIARLTYPYLDTSQKHSSASVTHPTPESRIHHMHGHIHTKERTSR